MTNDPKIGRGIRPRPTTAPAAELEPCGTYAAAMRHLRDGQDRAELDDDCSAALRRYQADAAKRARARKAGR